MEIIAVLTKNGEKTLALNDDEDVCYNCETKTHGDNSIPTVDSSVNFCRECYESFYCLECGKPLSTGDVMYHAKCMPKDVILDDLTPRGKELKYE